MPAFPVSVPMEFYQEVAGACGEPFADSYLFQASLRDGKLLPRTQTAYYALERDHRVRSVLRDRKITLLKPPPYMAHQPARAA
jgi:hypothetical protein